LYCAISSSSVGVREPELSVKWKISPSPPDSGPSSYAVGEHADQRIEPFLDQLSRAIGIDSVLEHGGDGADPVPGDAPMLLQPREAAQHGLDWARNPPLHLLRCEARRAREHVHLVAGDVWQRVELERRAEGGGTDDEHGGGAEHDLRMRR